MTHSSSIIDALKNIVGHQYVLTTKEETKLKYSSRGFFTSGKFTRFFELSELPSTYDISAKLENGLLTIRLKTKEEIEKSSTIEIQ